MPCRTQVISPLCTSTHQYHPSMQVWRNFIKQRMRSYPHKNWLTDGRTPYMYHNTTLRASKKTPFYAFFWTRMCTPIYLSGRPRVLMYAINLLCLTAQFHHSIECYVYFLVCLQIHAVKLWMWEKDWIISKNKINQLFNKLIDQSLINGFLLLTGVGKRRKNWGWGSETL